MRKKTIVTLCGSGIASSTIVAQKIKKACKEKGYEVEVKPSAFRDLEGLSEKVDLIITLTPIKFKNVPVVNGVCFLTGSGEEKALEEIFKILRSES